MDQPPVEQMINFTEHWWGQELDQSLVNRMAKAPFKHLDAFERDWPFHQVFPTDVERLHPELGMFDLPPLEAGELRPALRGFDGGELMGLVLLLYSESVVLSSAYAAPFALSGRVWSERGSIENRRVVVAGFRQLVRIRPLVDRGLVYFTNLDADPPFETYLRQGDGNWLLEEVLRRQFPEISSADLAAIVGGSGAHARVLALAAKRHLSLVAQDDFQHGLYFNASEFAWRFLTGKEDARPRVTPRLAAASTLARTAVPDLRTGTGAIAKLHDEEDLFVEWREALHQAIGMIGSMHLDSRGIADARVLLADELDQSTRRLREALVKSSALTRLTQGLRGFGIGASTALLTSFGDSIGDRVLNVGLGGAIGGALGAAAPGTTPPQRRRARLIDGVVFDFRALADGPRAGD